MQILDYVSFYLTKLSVILASTEIENELNVFNGTKSRLLERVTKLSGIEDLPISSIDQITKFAKEMCIKETGNSDGFDDTSVRLKTLVISHEFNFNFL